MEPSRFLEVKVIPATTPPVKVSPVHVLLAALASPHTHPDSPALVATLVEEMKSHRKPFSTFPYSMSMVHS
jgi:hypothetical protein